MIGQGVTLGGRYRLEQRVGGGGMGEVWRAQDTVLGRVVAVKILLPALMDEPGFATRFQNEARVMATIKHPGVVGVYDFGTAEFDGGTSTAYLVMEYVEGESLERLLNREGALDPARASRLIGVAAHALHAAHTAGVIHRDVKPANLLVRADDSVVLTDFGIARTATSARLTDRGMVLGTATYCAPEQAAGEELTPSVDVYALGIVAYQCLAGRPPFEGTTPVMIALKHMQEDPPPLPESVPEPIQQVVARAIAKAPEERWESAEAMSQAMTQSRIMIGADADDPMLADAPTGWYANPVAADAPTGRFEAPVTAARDQPSGGLDDPQHATRPWLRRRLGPVIAAVAVAGAVGLAVTLAATMPGDPSADQVREQLPSSTPSPSLTEPDETTEELPPSEAPRRQRPRQQPSWTPPPDTSEPDPGDSGDPDPGDTGDPDPGDTGDPDPGDTGDPDPGDSGDPDPPDGSANPSPKAQS